MQRVFNDLPHEYSAKISSQVHAELLISLSARDDGGFLSFELEFCQHTRKKARPDTKNSRVAHGQFSSHYDTRVVGRL